MTVLEVYLSAWGIICVFLVPYLLWTIHTLKKESKYYFDMWKQKVYENNVRGGK